MQAMTDAPLDTVFVFKPYDFINRLALEIALRPNLKVVMNYQGTDFFPTDRFWHRWIDANTPSAPKTRAWPKRVMAAKLPVIPNAVDTDAFPARRRRRLPQARNL